MSESIIIAVIVAVFSLIGGGVSALFIYLGTRGNTAAHVEDMVWKRAESVMDDMSVIIDELENTITGLENALKKERSKRIELEAVVKKMAAENETLRRENGALKKGKIV